MKKGKSEKSERYSRMVTGLTDVFILSILNQQPETGYSIRKILDEKMNVKVSYGLLYPILHNLESIGRIEGKWVPQSKVNNLKKKIYRITPKGKESLNLHIQHLKRIIDNLITIDDKNISISPSQILKRKKL